MMLRDNLSLVLHFMHILTLLKANLDRRSLDFIGIDPFNPMRIAMAEDERTAYVAFLNRSMKFVNSNIVISCSTRRPQRTF